MNMSPWDAAWMAGDPLEGHGSTYGHCESFLDGWGTQCSPWPVSVPHMAECPH